MNVSYEDGDLGGVNENSLRFWKHNGTDWTLVPGPNGVNTAENYVYANITEFSVFAPLGNVTGVNLEINKTGVPDPVSPGGTLNYTIHVSNTGNATATNVTVTETYDGNVTFVAAEPAPAPGNDTWKFATLNVSETGWINISVTVNSSVLNGTVLHNVVNVTCDEGVTDFDTENTTVFAAPVLNCTCGDICVNTTGWWRDGGAFNASNTPIQHAIDNATAGDTICVMDGTYTKNVDVYKRLTIKSENGSVNCIVNALDSNDHVFEVTADYVNISGFNVTGATGNDKAGIYLGYADYCNVSDNTASNDTVGIGLVVSSNNTITGNTASANNEYGIGLDHSNYNNITDNTASHNTVGIGLDHSNYNNITDNTASTNTEYGIGLEDSIYNAITSNTVSANADCGIALYSSEYNIITNNAASNNEYGIGLSLSDYNNISDNTATNNDCGIGLKEQSSYNNITSNTASANNEYGIGLSVSDYNNITSNTASSNWAGIGLSLSGYNNISDNNASNNYYGIGLESSTYNNLSGNTANSNNGLGIYLYSSSSNNLIYNNYFENTNNANDNGNNAWNTTKTAGTNIIGGPYLGGNYWSDYAGVDNDGDGLGNTLLPYNSSGNITTGGDWHPLVQVGFAPPNITSFAPPSPVNDTVCTWRTFNVTVNQTVNVSWYLNNTLQHTNVSTKEANYTLHAEVVGEHNVSAIASNGNGTDMQTWVWNVTAAPVPVLEITKKDAPDPVSPGGALNYTIQVNNAGNATATNVTVNETYDGNVTFVTAVPAPSPGNDTWKFTSLNASETKWVNISVIVNASVPNGTVLHNIVNVTCDEGVTDSDTADTTVLFKVLNCTCGNICVNETGWWRDGGAFNPSNTPIQHAINNAIAGETICVKDGTYNENVDVNKQLTIRSENGSANCIVNASDSSDHVFDVQRDYVNITGFSVENATGNNKAGIYLSGREHCNISDNIVTNNEYGIYLYLDSNNNYLINNTASENKGDGFKLESNSNHNSIIGNNASDNDKNGIRLYGTAGNPSSHNIVANNTVDLNDKSGIMIEGADSDHNTIVNNTCKSNDYGISVRFGDYNNLTKNTCNQNSEHGIKLYQYADNNEITNNTAISNTEYGIYISSSDNLIYNNYFNNTNNACDDKKNVWNTTKTLGTNIIGGPYLGGNYWSDYAGRDLNGDGLGDTFLPYNSNGNITNGGDYHPLVPEGSEPLLSIEKSDNPDPVQPGGTLNYSISVNNTGYANATNVTVTETYDKNVTFVSAVPVPSQGNDTWKFTLLNASETRRINISVTVNASVLNGTVLHNIVNVTCDEGVMDSDTENTTVFVAPVPALEITKTDNPDPVPAGGTLSYSISVNNTGNATATNVTVKETYDGNVTFVTAVPVPLQGNDTWKFATLNVSETRWINISVIVNVSVLNGTVLHNIVNVTCDEGVSDSDTENTTVFVAPVPALEMNKTSNPDPVPPGSTLNYSISVNNTGNATATNVTVMETYDKNVTFVSAVPVPSHGNDTWKFTLLNASETRWINISVIVNASVLNGTVLHNIVNVTCDEGVMDTDTENTTVFVAPVPALEITKTDNPDPVPAGGTLNYSISVNNTGNATATNVTVMETYDGNVTFVTAVPAPSPGNDTWKFTLLNASGTRRINISVTVNASVLNGTVLHNIVNVTCDEGVMDSDTENTTVFVAPVLNCTCGDICVNETGWWRDGGNFNANGTPIQAAVNNANAVETICVKDGTYTENVNVNKSLTIHSENGSASTTVQASNSNDHVFEVTADHVNVRGFTVTGAIDSAGIYLSHTGHCNVSGNNASDNFCGIWLSHSSNNSLSSNTADSNDYYGIKLDDSSDYNSLSCNIASNNDYGLLLDDSSNNALSSNIANWNKNDGIGLYHSCNYNSLSCNTASSNGHGLLLESHSSNNSLSNNTASNNKNDGIGLYDSSNYNSLTNNTASNNKNDGIRLHVSSNNSLTNNTASNNSNNGIFLDVSSSNLIYNNYFNNTNNAWDNGNNIWNTTKTLGTNIIGGPYLGGNYWSDYAGRDLNGDGLGDTLLPYNSFGGITNDGDYHPLVPVGYAPVLSIEKTDNPDPVSPGGTLNYTTSVNNVGNATATNVTVMETYDENVTFVTSVPAPSSGDDTWQFATLNASETRWINISVTVNASVLNGTVLHNIVNVTCDEGVSDFNTENTTVFVASVLNCTCGDICVNTTGWWRDGRAFNPSNTPIQHAIDNATAGDTICVKDGTYNENVDVYKPLTIKSESGAASTTVNAFDFNYHVFVVAADCVNISGFTVKGALEDLQAGIYLYGAHHCIISDNTASSNDVGIDLYNSNNNELKNNSASNNNCVGIRMWSSGGNTITNNTVSGNYYAGICLLLGSCDNNIHSNIVSNNGYNHVGDAGIYLYSSSSNNIYNNYFNNTNNAWDNGNNVWNTTKTQGTNIIGGPYLGGNYWSDYAGVDTDGDGLGDTDLPYNCSGDITNGGDWHPLVPVGVAPVLSIKKSDNPDPVLAGGTLNYSIHVNNTGNATATKVTVMETYDKNVTFVAAVPAPSSGNDTWQFATLNASETRRINISVTVNASVLNGTVLHNIVNVSCDEGVTDTDTANTTVFAIPRIQNVKISKWVKYKTEPESEYRKEIEDAKVCNNVSFKLAIQNNGTCTNLTGISVTDVLNCSLGYIEGSASIPPTTYENNCPDNQTFIWQFPGIWLEPGKYTNITFDAHVDEWGNDTNYARVEAENETGYTVSDEDTVWVNCTLPGTPVETATGTGTAYFATDAGTIEDLVAVDEATLPAEGKPTLVFPHGFFSFNIIGLTPGQTVVVTITLPDNVPVGTEYWKYHASEGGWIQIPMDSDDGDNVITITLVDGGLGDDDGTVNGVIVDQGGPGIPKALPVITSFSPPSPVNDTVCNWRTFNVTVDQTVNVSWYLNNTRQHTNVSTKEASYTLHAEVVGEHNVSAKAENANGTDMQSWVWNVTAAPVPVLEINKTGVPDPVSPGGALNYTISVNNTGNATATNVTVMEAYDKNVTFVSAVPVPSPGNDTWKFATLNASETRWINISVSVNASVLNGTVLHNVVNVSCDEGVMDTDTEDTTVLFKELNCTCGDICVNETGWWRDGGAFNPSNTPIQHAVDNAKAGDTICVKDGTYTENVDVAKSHLTIRSENGSASTTVQASNSNDSVFEVTADYVNISGFTVTGSSFTGGIYLDHPDHCTISNNNASNNFCGIWLSHSSNNSLSSNTADSNDYYGIKLDDSSDYNSLSCNIASNNDYGLLLDDSSNNALSSNIANWNKNDGIGLYHSCNYNSLSCNTASSNGHGLLLESHSSNNSLSNNTASNNKNDGIGLYDSSNYNTLANNTASDNDYGLLLDVSSSNLIYNNYFNNTNNAWDNGNNIWNTTKTLGTNIIGGPYLGGNYWSDYAGRDLNGDGLGDTLLPYNSFGGITNDGDYHPLVPVGYAPVLSIEKTDNPDPVSPGGTLNYTISVNNTGNATATNVMVMETYDANVTFVAAVPAPSSGDDTWQFQTLNASETRWIIISVTVNASVLNGTELHNIVNVTCDEGVSDTDTENTTVFVAPALPPNITSFAPPSPVNDTVCNWRTFNVTVDQTVNVSWYLNNTRQHTNVSTKEANYTLHAEVVGEHNVSAIASNGNGTDMQTWVWYVTAAPEPVLEINKNGVPDPVSPAGALNYTIHVNNTGNATAINVIVKETYDANVTFVSAVPAPSSDDDTWQFATLNASETRWINVSVTVNSPVPNGTVLHNIVNVTCDEGVTDTDTENTTVFVAPALPPNITSFAPPSQVSDVVCNWRTFNVTVDQTVNVSWYLNNTRQQTNESTKEASYTLHAVVVGEHNVSAIATNGNGTDMQTWVWNILQPTDLPDLEIADKWERGKNGLYSVYFVVKNIGSATAPRGHYATLYVDGEEMEHKLVRMDLKPGKSYRGTFRTRVELTGDSDTIKVCADNDNAVEESDEDNNCLENEWPCHVKPDLEIEDKSEEWVGENRYIVHYVIHNKGTGIAPAGHHSTLIVDGVEREHKHVPVDLAHCETYTDTFDAEVTCTGGSDTIEVCADSDNEVEESDEDNNCLENEWTCEVGKPDLEIEDKSEERVGENRYIVHYVIHNNGTGMAPADHHTTLIVDGEEVEHKLVPVELAQCETYIDTFDTEVTCTDGTDTIKVCADYFNDVDESDEDNNCLENKWSCEVGKPDLVIADKYERGMPDRYKVFFVVENVGTVTAPGGHYATLYVDGEEKENLLVRMDLKPGRSYSGIFRTRVKLTGDSDTIKVCADNDNDVDEADETNNCLENVWP